MTMFSNFRFRIVALAFAVLFAFPAFAQSSPEKVKNPWFMLGKLSSLINVTGTSSATLLPTNSNTSGTNLAGFDAWICNTGANDAYLDFWNASTGLTVSVASGSMLKASSCGHYDLYPIGQPSTPYTYILAITATGTTTLYVETGVGDPPFTGYIPGTSSGSVTAAGTNGTVAQAIQGINGGIPVPVSGAQSGIWQVTPTLSSVSTMTLTSTTTGYTAGQLIANNATAGSVTNSSFTMPTLGGAIPRLRLYSNDTTSTAWAGATVQVDLWSASPTWTNGDRGTWLPATGSASHIASYTCIFPSAEWGDGIATECSPTVGNYASVTATTVYWSLQAVTGSGVTGAGKTMNLIAERN
jgi:hypothetical protein